MITALPTVEEMIALLGLDITPERFIEIFKQSGPALISFSGGRTSALLLLCILVAHGGQLPDYVVVGFANTGYELEETLRFLHECSTRWGVVVLWGEWRPTPTEAVRIAEICTEADIVAWALANANPLGFELVGFNSASKNGEPFNALVALKERLPNGQERWCTQYLKVLTLHALMRFLGNGEPGDYIEPIGMRNDEGHRIFLGLASAEKVGRRVCYPLAKAEISKPNVHAIWFGPGRRYETSIKPLGFDLELPSLWGNCTLCFQMGKKKLEERVRRKPAVAPPWARMERMAGGTFSSRYSINTLIRRARDHKATPDIIGFDDGDDGDCTTMCPAETA